MFVRPKRPVINSPCLLIKKGVHTYIHTQDLNWHYFPTISVSACRNCCVNNSNHMMKLRFIAVVVMLLSCTERHKSTAKGSENEYTVESVRASLIRQEDTIIFSVIERARFPLNSPTYHQHYASIPHFSGSLLDVVLDYTEAIQAKVVATSYLA